MDRSCVGTDSELKDSSAALVSRDKENGFHDGSILSCLMVIVYSTTSQERSCIETSTF